MLHSGFCNSSESPPFLVSNRSHVPELAETINRSNLRSLITDFKDKDKKNFSRFGGSQRIRTSDRLVVWPGNDCTGFFTRCRACRGSSRPSQNYRVSCSKTPDFRGPDGKKYKLKHGKTYKRHMLACLCDEVDLPPSECGIAIACIDSSLAGNWT